MLRTGFARTDDDLQLYWRTMGPDDAPVLVCCNGVGVSTFFWKYLTHHFRDRYRIVLWDYRGHGLSSTPEDIGACDLTIERSAKDLRCILDHLEIHEPVILLGHSMGCQVILEYHKQFREQVRALLPMFGTFARPLDTFMDNPNSRKIFEVVSRFAAMGGKPGSRLMRPLYASPLAFEVGRRTGLFDRYYASRQDMEMYLEHLNHMDTRVFFAMVEAIKDHDLTDFLPQVAVPTLIIAAENDLFTPLHRSRKMAELIPGSELLVIPGGSHAAIVEHPETINRRIEKFFLERVFSPKGDGERVDPAGQQRLL